MIQSNSISIELCSAGPLDLIEGKYYTWFGLEVDPKKVATLSKPFKGYLHFHKYTNKQINSLKALLIIIRDRHGIDLHSGMFEKISKYTGTTRSVSYTPEVAFNYELKNESNKDSGLYTHGNLSETKLDLFPQTELIEMIRSLK